MSASFRTTSLKGSGVGIIEVYLTFVIILSCVFKNNQFRFACKVYRTIKERVDFDLFYMNNGFDSS